MGEVSGSAEPVRSLDEPRTEPAAPTASRDAVRHRAAPRIPRYAAALGFILVIGVVVGTAVYTATGFSQDARTAPLVIGVPLLLAIVAQIIRDVLRVRRGDTTVGSMSEMESDAKRPGESGSSVEGKTTIEATADGTLVASGAQLKTDDRRTNLPMAGLWVLILAGMTYVLGMLVAIPLFIGLFMRVFGKERWLVVVLYAGGVTAFVYTLFVYLLNVRLFQGMFGGMLPWP